MKRISPEARTNPKAFTLIELLVVIAIIGVLAGLLFPLSAAVKNARMKKVAYSELEEVKNLIESFKGKTGYYPPDNPGNTYANQLYFELSGTVLANNVYTTLDQGAQIQTNAASFTSAFGPTTSVSGFVNSATSAAGTDDKAPPVNFLASAHLKPGQVVALNSAYPLVKYLVCSDGWSGPGGGKFAPWQYISSHPTNNPASYDLWVDIYIGGKTNRFCNWSKDPLIVP